MTLCLAMHIMTDARMLGRIEAFLAAHKMPPSRFGRDAMGDPALVFQLREGRRSLSLKNAERIGIFMSGHQARAEPESAAA